MIRRAPRAAVLAALGLIVAACGSSTPTPPASGAASAPASAEPSVLAAPSASGAASGSPSPSTSAPGTPAPSGNAALYASTYRPEEGARGGEVVVGDWRPVTNLNPYYSDDPVDGQLFGATMRSLLRLTADGHWAPSLAAAPIDGSSIVRDKTGPGFSVRVRLRPGLRWSDGQPLTMTDFKVTREWVLDKKQSGVNAMDWAKVDRVDVSPDGLSGAFHFADATTDWMPIVGLNPPLPAHYLSKVPPASGPTAYPLSDAVVNAPVSGPYRYEHASPDEVVLVRNDQWHAGHPAYLDRVTFRTFGDDKDQLETAVSDGAVDVGLDFTADDLTVLSRLPQDRIRLSVAPTWLYEHLDFNTQGKGPGTGHPALADPKVRTAIARAIDRTALYRAAYPLGGESVTRACTNAPPDSWWSEPNPDGLCPSVDEAAANAALDAAGYRLGANGVRTDPKSHQPLELRFCTGTDTAHRAEAEYLAESLARIGVRLDPTYVDVTTVLLADWSEVDGTTACSLARGTFDVALYSSPLGLDLVSDYYLAYHSSQIPSDANDGTGFNVTRFRSPTMDVALGTLRSTVDPGVALGAARRVQQFSGQLAAEIPLFFRPSIATIASRVRNVAPNPTAAGALSSDLWNVEDWSLAR
ncbi:MAG TPA: ABC transporter substrate-binding protein [Candidatus Limnocylindrales bacterium]|nr:ABC transporter substrate-binding protein [Candidatus Limnocylindrales bacterium]